MYDETPVDRLLRAHLKPRPPPVVSIDSGSHRPRVLARRDSLVNAHLHLVPPLARRMLSRLPPCFEMDDLISAGYVALIHSAVRYRPRQHNGAPFWGYASPRVRGAMLDTVRGTLYTESTMPPLDSLTGEPVDGARIEIAIDEQRLKKRVAEAITRLPESQQQVLAAYYAENLPRGPKNTRYNPATGRLENDLVATVGALLGLPEWRVIREHADAIAELRRRLTVAA